MHFWHTRCGREADDNTRWPRGKALTTHLYLAPAGAGKTEFVLRQARTAAQGLRYQAVVCVPTALQREACYRRLADMGGAMGVRIVTFDWVYSACLDAAGWAYTELSEPVQFRLVRSVVDNADLSYYAPLRQRPGFIQALQGLLAEWKATKLAPEELQVAVDQLSNEQRLAELADLYAAYQRTLRDQGWVDRAGKGWLAVEALSDGASSVARDWPLLCVDGFDNLTDVQLALLVALAPHVGELVITLTGEPVGPQRPAAHDRFRITRQRIEKRLGLSFSPLPNPSAKAHPVLRYLETQLFRVGSSQRDASGVVEWIEAPDRAGEVRAALRWIKERLVLDGMRANEVALLTRQTAPYRSTALQVAAEFGIPMRVAGGLPLMHNPAIIALLDLLRVVLPASPDDPQMALPSRLVVEAWRSPYFDWNSGDPEDGKPPVGLEAGDAEALDVVASWGSVMGGLLQWEEALGYLTGSQNGEGPDEERGRPRRLPAGPEARSLSDKFRRFLRRIEPPAGNRSYREWVAWLESLIGADVQSGVVRYASRDDSDGSLNMVRRARAAGDNAALMALVEMDIAALRALKDVLRGLVWAEEALASTATVNLTTFFADLEGAVQATSYRLPVPSQHTAVLFADVVEARGLPLRAAAIIGLAEGEFPARVTEDPFLREDDREQLRLQCGLPMESSLTSAEVEFFYEAATRPTERLLLVRPRLAENGATWEASPYWEEVARWLHVQPLVLRSHAVPEPANVASLPELMQSLAVHRRDKQAWVWSTSQFPERSAALERAFRVLDARRKTGPTSPFAGDLTSVVQQFAAKFGPATPWSVTRLETYRACPFEFLASHVLKLEPRPEPREGPDGRQLGNIYHRLLAAVYEGLDAGREPLVTALVDRLKEVADPILDHAPDQEGFRATSWWQQTRQEIMANVQETLAALHDSAGENWMPVAHERRFDKDEALIITHGTDSFRVRGTIDRIDRRDDGGLRVIDYKTAGPADFSAKAVQEGRKLQLPLYSLAAAQALALGIPTEGYYWHLQKGERSGFRMSTFKSETHGAGPQAAIATAVEKAWEAVRGVRSAYFVPQPPPAGCPWYCPMAGTCWLFRPAYWRR